MGASGVSSHATASDTELGAVISKPAADQSMLIVELTPDQHRLLVELVNESGFKGKQASFVVSVQRALAEAMKVADEDRTEKG